MDQIIFETKLASDGFTEIEAKTLGPRPANAEHARMTLIFAGWF